MTCEDLSLKRTSPYVEVLRGGTSLAPLTCSSSIEHMHEAAPGTQSPFVCLKRRRAHSSKKEGASAAFKTRKMYVVGILLANHVIAIDFMSARSVIVHGLGSTQTRFLF